MAELNLGGGLQNLSKADRLKISQGEKDLGVFSSNASGYDKTILGVNVGDLLKGKLDNPQESVEGVLAKNESDELGEEVDLI